MTRRRPEDWSTYVGPGILSLHWWSKRFQTLKHQTGRSRIQGWHQSPTVPELVTSFYSDILTLLLGPLGQVNATTPLPTLPVAPASPSSFHTVLHLKLSIISGFRHNVKTTRCRCSRLFSRGTISIPPNSIWSSPLSASPFSPLFFARECSPSFPR